MNEFIEQNRRLIKFYRLAARIIGWVLICGGTIWLSIYVFCILVAVDAAGEMVWPHTLKNVIYSSSSYVFELLFPGLIAIIVAQLIAYIIGNESKQPRLLQYGQFILYAFAALVIVRAILHYCLWHGVVFEGQNTTGLLFIQPLIVPVVAKVLIIVALAQAFRRILTVIEESKTLV
jgi:hypothetical protein